MVRPRKPPGDWSTTPKKEDIERRRKRQEVLDLRCKGYSLAEIAEKLGVSKTRIHQILRQELDKLNDRFQEKFQAHLRMELVRLDALYKKAMEKAERGDMRAAEVCLKISERRAQLLGLDAPKKIVQANMEVPAFTDAELLEEARRLGLPAPRHIQALPLPEEDVPNATTPHPVEATPATPPTDTGGQGVSLPDAQGSAGDCGTGDTTGSTGALPQGGKPGAPLSG